MDPPGPEEAEPQASNPEPDLFDDFVGRNALYYRARRALVGRTWNWAAFFLGVFWIFYRKMYRVAFIFVAIVTAETLISDIVFLFVMGLEEVPDLYTKSMFLIYGTVCGTLGTSWYIHHTERKITQLEEATFDEPQRRETARRTGGTSVGIALLGTTLFFVAFVGLLMLVEEVILSNIFAG